MDDFKLKLLLAILSSIIFSFLFILLAFTSPTKNEEPASIKKHANLRD